MSYVIASNWLKEVYEQCEYEAFLRFVMGYEPEEPEVSKALDFGKETHRYLEGFDEAEFVLEFNSTIGRMPTDKEIEEGYNKWLSSIPAKCQVVGDAVKKKLANAIEKTEVKNVISRGEKIKGFEFIWYLKVDMIDSAGIMADYKFTGRSKKEDWLEFAAMEKSKLQSGLYCLAMNKEEMIYICHNSFPHHQQGKNESITAFKVRLKNEIENPKEGDLHSFNFISKPDPEQVKEEMRVFEHRFAMSLRSNTWLKNRKACTGRYGKKCPFFNLCKYKDTRGYRQADYNYKVQNSLPDYYSKLLYGKPVESRRKYYIQKGDFLPGHDNKNEGEPEEKPVIEDTQEAMKDLLYFIDLLKIFMDQGAESVVNESIAEFDSVIEVINKYGHRYSQKEKEFINDVESKRYLYKTKIETKLKVKLAIESILVKGAIKPNEQKPIDENRISPKVGDITKISYTKGNSAYITNASKALGITEKEMILRLLNY